MLFWPFVIIGTVVITLMVASDQRILAPQGEQEVVQAVFIVTLVALLLITLLARVLMRTDRRVVVSAMAWVGIGATLAAGWHYREDVGYAVDRLRGQFVPSLAVVHAPGEVELRRAWDGHFRADARVNGRTIRMMVDTGASMVLIPFERAAAIGIDPELLSFSMPVSTANGATTVAPVRLATVQVGPIVLRDVEAAVARRGRLETPLLGMSFLEGMTETTFRGDRLILRHGEPEDPAWVLTGDGTELRRMPQGLSTHH